MCAELFALWRRDPVAWSEDVLFQPFREWQPEAADKFANHTKQTVVACRDAGKSGYAARLGWHWFTTHPNGMFVTIAPIWKQVKEAIWVEIRKTYRNSWIPTMFPEFEVLTTEAQVDGCPDWRAYGVSSSRAENIEGRHAEGGVLVIFDESKGVKDDFYTSAQGMLGDKTSEKKQLAIGTPGPPQGWFWESHTKWRSQWSTVQVRSRNIERLAEHSEAERIRLGENNPWYLQQQEAEFAGSDERSIIPLGKILEARHRKFKRQPDWKRTLGYDHAPENGSGLCVLTFRWGPCILFQTFWSQTRETISAARIAAAIRWFLLGKTPVPAEHKGATKGEGKGAFIFDAVGVGAGMGSMVEKELGGIPKEVEFYGFIGGAQSYEPDRFATLKTEALYELRQRFMDDQMSIPDEPMLIGNLSSYWHEVVGGGRTKSFDPEPSPDHGDSALYAFSDALARTPMAGINPDWL